MSVESVPTSISLHLTEYPGKLAWVEDTYLGFAYPMVPSPYRWTLDYTTKSRLYKVTNLASCYLANKGLFVASFRD